MEPRREYTLITGSCSGLGASLFRKLAPCGSLILQVPEPAELPAGFASAAQVRPHLTWPCDFKESVDPGRSLSTLLGGSGAVVSRFIHLSDTLRALPLNSAQSPDVLQEFQANVFSATSILRSLLRKSVNADALRSIVLVSNIASRFGSRECGVSAAARGALDSLARSLAVELAPGVRVNSILSGLGSLGSGTPDGYLMGPGCEEDVASMAEFLISDHARWVTGQQFIVDGGRTAH